MSYKIQYVGMVCFLNQADGSKLALLPDGRQETPAHIARIVVSPMKVISETGWRRGPVDRALGRFVVPACSISIEGADQSGTLDATSHQGLPRLQQLRSGFTINPVTARTVATMEIRQGTLQSFLYPGAGDSPTTSIISQLDVAHAGPITITITPTGRNVRQRTIVLQPGTEIAILNDSVGDTRAAPHFHIYDMLTDSNVSVGDTVPPTPVGMLPESPSRHHVFGGQIDGNDLCPNTGCCP
jgi:hypothetical protein